jgi:arginine/lysine/ornithine decarboxylase
MSEVIKMMVVNSPLFDFFATACTAVCWILGKINKAIIYNSAEIYMGEFPKVKSSCQAA